MKVIVKTRILFFFLFWIGVSIMIVNDTEMSKNIRLAFKALLFPVNTQGYLNLLFRVIK